MAHAQHRRVTADERISHGPVDLWGVVLSGTGGVTVASLHDGENATAPNRLDVLAEENVSTVIGFTPAMRFDVGLFANVGANIRSMTVLFEPLER